jgi:hypothetical protein
MQKANFFLENSNVHSFVDEGSISLAPDYSALSYTQPRHNEYTTFQTLPRHALLLDPYSFASTFIFSFGLPVVAGIEQQ